MDLGNGLSLIPAFEVELTIYRKDVAPPAIDEWQLKETLVDLIKRNTKYVIADDRHLKVQKVPNLQKTRKEDPVAKGRLHVLAQNQDAEELSKTFEQKLKKLDFRIGGTKFYLQAHVLPGNSLSDLQQKWQSVFGEDVEDYNTRNPGDRPDTFCLSGIPSRWLADPKISSNASVEVSHSIFSHLGEVRKVEIVGSTEIEKLTKNVANSGAAEIATRLNCEVFVQFEDFDSFFKAVQTLVGKALVKTGTRLIATFSLKVETSDFFSEKNVRGRRFEKMRKEEEERRIEAIKERKAELKRLEKERREAEEKEKILREQEEKLRAEEEEARRREEERLRIEMERKREEEERLRLEEERKEAERKKFEEEEREREEKERKMREELQARLEREKRRIKEENERKEKEDRLRRQLEERMREKRAASRRQEERLLEEEERRYRGKTREDQSLDDRWQLDVTHSEASLIALENLKRSAEEAFKSQGEENKREAENSEEELDEVFPKRLRSLVIAV